MIHVFFEKIQDFLYQGGWVLQLIFFTIFLLWVFISERFWYLYFDFKKDCEPFIEKWTTLPDRQSHSSLKIWQADLSALDLLLRKHTSYIKVLIKLCPLMGLLGTVTGMITVFQVMAEVGTGNVRLMASGISMATIPTMAGMVGALSGIYTNRLIEIRIAQKRQKLIEQFSPFKK